MNPFLHISPLGGRNCYLLRTPYSVGVSSHWWLLCLLLTGLSTVGWGQCFNTTTLPLAYTTYTNPLRSFDIAVGDFNGDGQPDLARSNVVSKTVSVQLGTGSGVLGPSVDYIFGAAPWSIVVADFNADGKTDLATGNPEGNTVSVLLGTGSGSFSVTQVAAGRGPVSLVVGDFNSDGKPDLATANYFSDNVSVLLGNGVGGFGAPSYFAAGDGPQSIDVGDFNSDGKPDLAVGNSISNNVSVLFSCTGPITPPSFAITGVTTVSCTMVTATERRLSFTPTYAGVTGQPISFSVVNEMLPTTSPGPYTLRLYTDNPTIMLNAKQTGTAAEATFSYNWLAACSGGGSPRLAAGVEPIATVQIKVLGNPVREAVEVDVTGGENRPLHLSLTDLKGRIIGERHTERAGASEHYRFDVSTLPPGTLFLKTIQGQSETVRVLKVN